jgi:hypothetical protein
MKGRTVWTPIWIIPMVRLALTRAAGIATWIHRVRRFELDPSRLTTRVFAAIELVLIVGAPVAALTDGGATR